MDSKTILDITAKQSGCANLFSMLCVLEDDEQMAGLRLPESASPVVGEAIAVVLNLMRQGFKYY